MNTTYSSQKTALVLIDVLNEFFSSDGKAHNQIKGMLEKLQTVENIKRLLEGARKAGIHIIFAPHGLDEHCFDHVKHLHPRFQWSMDNHLFWVGSKGADFFEPLKPLAGETVVGRHHVFDSFIGTDLEEQLRAKGIEYVVLAGLTSQTCVEGTGRHALELGYHVTFLQDAVADFTEKAHNAALEISYPTFGHESLTIAEFLGALDHE